MAEVNQQYNPKNVGGTTNVLPTPIISLGWNYTLQHYINGEINTFINSTFYDYVNSINADGNTFANDNIKIGVSIPDGDNSFFLQNTPMIFMEVYNSRSKKSHVNQGDTVKTQWTHIPNDLGPINNNLTLAGKGRNYGGGSGAITGLTTEWDFIRTRKFHDQVIEINPKLFYNIPLFTLPIRKVDWVVDSYAKSLRKGNRVGIQQNAISGSQKVVTGYKQPIRFRFACINPDDPTKRNLIFSNPSDVIVISPKGGYFQANDDHYWYDFQAHFGY